MANIQVNESDFIFYNGEDGKVHAQVILGAETVWISQKSMAEVFGVQRPAITKHLLNIFEEGELIQDSVSSIMEHTASDNKMYKTTFYNLDAIIAVGYRVNSYKATKFRQWATRVLKEYLVKGFVLDDERLKQGNKLFGKDYFRELLERIREIRTSERMFYEKITDLYATSIDYDKNDPITHAFYAKVQNKLEYAIVGKTSAEIIKSRADAQLPYMGLKTFKNSNKDGNVQKADITVAKNYLSQDELRNLNLLVSSFLDHAEMIVSKHTVMKMSDWASRLDKFLDFNDYKILNDAGKIQKKVADAFAEKQWEQYKAIQESSSKSDFGAFIENVKNGTLPTEGVSLPEKKKRASKPKTRECPVCGKECAKNAEYCDGNVEVDGAIVPCTHMFE